MTFFAPGDTRLPHVQLAGHQDPQDFLCRTSLQLFSTQPVLVPGVIPAQARDFEFVGPFLQPAKVSLKGRITIWYTTMLPSFVLSVPSLPLNSQHLRHPHFSSRWDILNVSELGRGSQQTISQVLQLLFLPQTCLCSHVSSAWVL